MRHALIAACLVLTAMPAALAVGWLEVTLPEETEAYCHAMTVAHRIVAAGQLLLDQVACPFGVRSPRLRFNA